MRSRGDLPGPALQPAGHPAGRRAGRPFPRAGPPAGRVAPAVRDRARTARTCATCASASGLDSGYVSRLVKPLRRKGLIQLSAAPGTSASAPRGGPRGTAGGPGNESARGRRRGRPARVAARRASARAWWPRWRRSTGCCSWPACGSSEWTRPPRPRVVRRPVLRGAEPAVRVRVRSGRQPARRRSRAHPATGRVPGRRRWTGSRSPAARSR